MEFEYYMRDLSIYPVHESWKLVRGSRPAPLAEPIVLHAVRGSWAQMNVCVTTPDDTILLLADRPAFGIRRPVAETPVIRATAEMAGFAPRLAIVDAVMDDDGLAKGDVILSADSAHVLPWHSGQLLLTVDVPADAAPGSYTGRIRFYIHSLFYDESLVREIEFTLCVEDVCLPAPEDRKFYLNLWQHVFNIARKHEVAAYSAEHLAALEPYAKALGELGNKSATLLLSDVPWAGQRCYKENRQPSDLYEYNYVRIRRKADGTFVYDFSFAEAYLEMMFRYGATEIMATGLYGIWAHADEGFVPLAEDWPDAIRLSYIDEKDGCLRFMRSAAEIEDYMRAVYAWFREKDYLRCTYAMGDEVDRGELAGAWSGSLGRVHAIMPDLKMEWDMPPHNMLTDRFSGEKIDLYTPALAEYYEDKELLPALRERLGDAKVVWANCCWPPVLNTFLYSNLNEVRLHGMVTEAAGMDGFLRWNFTVWPNDPRHDLRYFFPNFPAGDTCFVYPGNGGQCLLSLRYLALKRGMEDFELMQMVKALPGGRDVIDRALACVLRVSDLSAWDFNDFNGREKYFSLDGADYDAARQILIDALKEA